MTTQPDGSIRHVFRDPNGYPVTQLEPPPNFNPLAATDALLRQYQIPVRPTDPDALALWNQTMQAHPYKAVVGAPCESKFRNAIYSTNWSGIINEISATHTPYPPGTFTEALADFSIPTYSSCPHRSGNSIWAGTGGRNSALLQAGTASENQFDANTNHAWYEYAGGHDSVGEVQLPVSVATGNRIEAQATWTAATSTAFFRVWNQTTNQASPISLPLDPRDFSGTTAEFISEVPNLSVQPLDFRQFATTKFLYMTARTPAGNNLAGNLDHEGVFATTNGSSTGLKKAGPDNGMSSASTFTDFWHRCE